jgi:DNA-binding Lrp family transcriptional regulator
MELPLTRPQRSIYLLIDGRRTVADLARCTRKSLQEVERLLSELRERGLIAI